MIKPYYQDKWVTIYHGDCREILPTLEPVDLVLTDPPYGVNKAEWDQNYDISALSIPIARKLGLMCGVSNIPYTAHQIGNLIYKWMLIAHLINGMTRGAMGYGNYIPCLVYTDGVASVHGLTTDCLDIVVGAEPKPNHPSPKPSRVIDWFIERLSESNETILDPFLGSGTTAVCAKKLGRKCIGIEISEKYCEIAVKRLAQEVMELGL